MHQEPMNLLRDFLVWRKLDRAVDSGRRICFRGRT